MFGTKPPTEEGALVVLASGHDDLRDRAQPVFDAVGNPSVPSRLVEEPADRRGMELPLIAAVRRQLEAVVEERGDDDLSAAFLAGATTASASR